MIIYSVYWHNPEADHSTHLVRQFSTHIKAAKWVKDQDDRKFLMIEREHIE
jgi:hypothetical protein